MKRKLTLLLLTLYLLSMLCSLAACGFVPSESAGKTEPSQTDTDGLPTTDDGAVSSLASSEGTDLSTIVSEEQTPSSEEPSATSDVGTLPPVQESAQPTEKSKVGEIYADEYVDPKNVAITDRDGNARNLIYIYLESFETTYASKAVGGAQESTNYIPRMTALAEENISFSDCDGLGGFHSIMGTGWTVGAMIGTTSGVPFSLEVFGQNTHNSQGRDGRFLNGLTTIGDVLAAKGYQNEFFIGSEIAFGGTQTYVTLHGNYKTFDLQTARDRGYLPKDYDNGFWGFEDMYLYEFAKDEILDLAAGDQPFNFTMMTIDTHHVGGYVCDLCRYEHDTRLGNVVSCADRQLCDFIEWCKQQDFYENTTIVITGDHPRMDTQLIDDTPFYERTIYNCILNSVAAPRGETKNRVFTSLDMFPTTLAAMGFEIEGERLGLGVNLFSELPTLCEQMGEGEEGYNRFEAELTKYSEYYKQNFVLADK